MSGTGDFVHDVLTKFTDEEITILIESAKSILETSWYDSKEHIATNAAASTALAMIAYNDMIDHRWIRYYGQEWHKYSHILTMPREELKKLHENKNL